jgi:hypothetical protein
MRYCLTYLMAFFIANAASAQFVYFTGGAPITGNQYVWKINPVTCEICPVLNFNFGSNFPLETLILPNGDLLVSTINGIFRFDPPSNTPVATISGSFNGAYVHPNGTIYTVVNLNSLSVFNPTNNTFTTIGNFPAGFAVYELFFFNGQLYGMGDVPPSNSAGIVQINITNPSASTVVQTPPQFFIGATSAPNGGPIYVTDFFGGTDLSTYNFTTNTVTPGCPIPLTFVRSFSVAPLGVPELPCVCLSSAGSPTLTNVNACVPNSISVPFTAAQPDFNDIVRYVIYSNPASPLTSIIQTSTTPNFNFAPPFVAGTTYYVAQLVGNNLNGSVDLADPCLQISTATAVTWRPKPTVVSLSQTGDLCPGACTNVTITLSGTPPFTYYWAMQQGGNFITPQYTVFNTNTNPSVFQACVPASAVAGAVTLQICGIVDAYCANP